MRANLVPSLTLSEQFFTRREPIRELISTFNELHIDSEDEERVVEAIDDASFLPLEIEEGPESNPVTSLLGRLGELKERLTNMEKRINVIKRWVKFLLRLKWRVAAINWTTD